MTSGKFAGAKDYSDMMSDGKPNVPFAIAQKSGIVYSTSVRLVDLLSTSGKFPSEKSLTTEKKVEKFLQDMPEDEFGGLVVLCEAESGIPEMFFKKNFDDISGISVEEAKKIVDIFKIQCPLSNLIKEKPNLVKAIAALSKEQIDLLGERLEGRDCIVEKICGSEHCTRMIPGELVNWMVASDGLSGAGAGTGGSGAATDSLKESMSFLTFIDRERYIPLDVARSKGISLDVARRLVDVLYTSDKFSPDESCTREEKVEKFLQDMPEDKFGGLVVLSQKSATLSVLFKKNFDDISGLSVEEARKIVDIFKFQRPLSNLIRAKPNLVKAIVALSEEQIVLLSTCLEPIPDVVKKIYDSAYCKGMSPEVLVNWMVATDVSSGAGAGAGAGGSGAATDSLKESMSFLKFIELCKTHSLEEVDKAAFGDSPSTTYRDLVRSRPPSPRGV